MGRPVRDRYYLAVRTVAPSLGMPRLDVTTAPTLDAFDVSTAAEAERHIDNSKVMEAQKAQYAADCGRQGQSRLVVVYPMRGN